ncbi:AMP-binding protein [Sphingomonas sp. MMS24-J45]|uniref:AMP-binding protein n=1 Tax=Sphingomonas sp. MMS24-J45 TaxID=3238806 RepID=UPI00384BE70E
MIARASEADMDSSAPAPVATPAEITTTLAEIVAGHAQARGTAIAVQDAATALTYAELTQLAARVGESVEAFVVPGRPIGILLAPSTDYVAAILGLLARGICYVPLDASFPAARNAEIALRAGMSAVIVDAATAALMRDAAPEIPQMPMPTLDEGREAPFHFTATPDDVAAIFYTSGSTGVPKGVFQSQRSILYEVLRHSWRAGLRHDEGVALIYSPSVSGATRDLYGSLAAGARLVIADVRSQGLTKAASIFADANVAVLHIMPGLFRAMFSEPIGSAAGRLLRGLRLVHLISDRVQRSDVELFRRCFPRACRLCIDLATTETYSYASWYPDHDVAIGRPLVPVGYPRDDAPLRLIDETGAEVTPGELGEIVVSSHALSLGYWRDPVMTAERFKPSASLPGAREFRTGDMGRILPGGLLEFIGRKDRQIKIRGNTVHLAEIEAVLAACPGVSEAAVLARPGAENAIVAYYVERTDDSADPAAVARWCAERLPGPMRPSELIARDALPRLPSGKPDLVSLGRHDEERARAAAQPDLARSLGSGMEQVVRESWEQILGPGSFDADASFEAAGGDSLKGLNLVVELERRLDRQIDWELLDFQTTPAMLTARLRAGDAKPAGGGPLLVLCPGIFGGDIVIADFARRVSPDFTPIIADYRWGGDWFKGDFDRERLFDRIVAAVVAQLGPDGAPGVWLLGNSLGGKVAVETARRLIAAGVKVDFIGVLDGAPGDPLTEHERRRIVGQAARSARPRLDESARKLAAWLAKGEQHRLARHLLGLLRLIGRTGLEASLRREITWHVRVAQFRDVPAGPVSGRLSLFLSNEIRFDPALYPYLGWDRLFGEIDIVTMDVPHSEFMHPANAAALIGHLVTPAAASGSRSTERAR